MVGPENANPGSKRDDQVERLCRVAYVSARTSAAAWRYQVRVLVHAPASELAARLTPAVGRVEERDASTCWLHTGSDSLDGLAVHLGLLGVDFEVTGPPELVERLELLARRYARAVGVTGGEGRAEGA